MSTEDVAAYTTMAALRGVRTTFADWINPHGMVLRSSDLHSEHGFDNGSAPTAVVLMVEDWHDSPRMASNEAWHPTLHGLVHEFLLPATGHSVENVRYMPESQNPVRAVPGCARFDDVEVTVAWTDVFARLLPHLLAYNQWRERLLYRFHAD